MRTIEIIDKKLSLQEKPIPTPAEGEVLIKVAAAGVNRADIFQVEGSYPGPEDMPNIPGLEVSGTIEAVGEGLQPFDVGQEVCALLAGGGYAEYVTAPVEQVLPVPEGVDLVSSAGIPECFFTIWLNLVELANIQPHETLLVHGGTSGIGTTAIQLANAFDISIFVTAGSDEKCQACLDLGASAAINYKTQDFVEEVKKLTDGNGVDMILDMVGGSYIERNFHALAVDGGMISIAFLDGAKADVNFAPLLMKRLSLFGSTLRSKTVEEKAHIADSLAEHIWPLFASGDIKPVIDTTFPLEEAENAHKHMLNGKHVGKILLAVC